MAWLYEGRTSVYVLLLIAATICAGIWWQTRQRRYAIGMAGLTFLACVYTLLHFLVESDSEQIVRKLNAMKAAVKNQDMDGVFEQISEDFQFAQRNKAYFRAFADRQVREGQVTEVEIWEIKPTVFLDGNQPLSPLPLPPQDQGKLQGRRLAQIAFSAKPKGTMGAESVYYGVVATFILDPDGQWRLLTFELFNPVNNQPLHLGI